MIPVPETISVWPVQRRGKEVCPDSPGGSRLLTLGEDEGKPAEWPLVFFFFCLAVVFIYQKLCLLGDKAKMKLRQEHRLHK